MHHQCRRHHHHHQHQHHRQPGEPGTARLLRRRVATPGSPPRCAPDPSGQPPALRREQHGEQWHGHMRTDEYHWLTQLQPTHPTVLQHLQAEGAYTISALAHTRDLQLQLQARLGDWLLAAALQEEAQQEDGDTTQQQQQQQTVAPDWMGGQGSLCYQQRSSLGWPGTRMAGQRFFSLPALPTARIAPAAATAAPAAGAPPLLHFRAADAACAAWQEQQEQGRAGSSDGAAAPGGRQLPPGSTLCWSEAAEQHSARPARASSTHSLATSPDGRFLAVTHKPAGGSSSDGAFTLSVIDCSTGCQVGASTAGVDGPIQWVQRQQQASTHQQASRPQHLLFVAADQLEVHCLSLLPAVDAATAAATRQQCVFKDPQRVSVSLAAAGTLDCIVVHAADGLPRQLLFYSGCAGASSSSRQWLWPDNPAAWHELLPPAAVTPDSGSGDGGVGAASSAASVRLIASVAGSWLLTRYSSAAAPQGCLHAARMPAAAGPVSRVHLQPVPLPDHQQQQPQQQQAAWLMEAVFPVSSQQAGGDLQVLVLRCSWQLVDTAPQQPLQPSRHVVRADWYHVLACQGQQQRQRLPGASSSGSLQVQHAGGCVLPLPVPFFQLAGGAWQPQAGHLALTFSSLFVPLSRLSVDLQQLAAAHAGQQQQQALADGQHAQVQLQQAVPPGFDATAYAAAQLAVPSSADSGVRIPVSLAWHRHRVQRAALQQLAGDDVTAGAVASDSSTSNATPMLLSCYGSYAIKEAAGFEPELLQLLDDGWVVGIAHVRGGGWLGPAWAEAGRCCGKRTSIRDLTDVLEYVQQAGVCSPGHLFLQAASAGAWLAASAVLQARAGLVQGVVLSVPCCDPLGLMLHQQQGRLELGDAIADAQVYHSVRGWAPYDVLGQHLQAAQADGSAQPSGAQEDNTSSSSDGNAPAPPARLPHFLIRAALLDDDVPLHDPVRTAARLRRLQRYTASRGPRVLLRVVSGGHTAFSSGDVREAALKLAFLMTVARGGLQS